VVDQYSRNSVQLFSSFGQLVELSPEELRIHKEDLTKRNISAWKKKGASATENWTTKEEGNSMEKCKSGLLNMANSSLSFSSPDPSSSSNYSSPQISDNQCKDRFYYSENQHFPSFPAEEPPNKTSMNTHLATEYPGSVEESDQRLSVMDQDIFLSYGGILTLDHEFPEDWKKFPNRTLPLEDNISENLVKSEDEEKQHSVIHYFGSSGLTLDGLDHHDFLDSSSTLSKKFKNDEEIQESPACLDTGNQLCFIPVPLIKQKWTATLPLRIATRSFLDQAQFLKNSLPFGSSHLMGTSAKLGEEASIKALEFKFFCLCFLPTGGGHIQQNVSYNVGIGCVIPREEKAIDVLRKTSYGSNRRIDQFVQRYKMVSLNPLHKSLAENSKDLAWVSEGTCCETLRFQNERNEVNISAVIIVKMKASEAVGAAYYILKHKVDQFAPGQKILPCLLSIGDGHVQQNASYNLGIGYGKPREEETIDMVRTHVYCFNQKEGQVTTTQQWKICSFEKFSRVIFCSELTGRREVQRSKSEGFVLEAERSMRIEGASRNNYLLRRQRWNCFEPITILAMKTFFYIWNRSFVAYDRFIFFFWIGFLSMDSCLTRTTWMASIYLLSLKRVQATTKTQRQFNRSLADDDIYHHRSVILSYLLDYEPLPGQFGSGLFPLQRNREALCKGCA
jgi:hypothetical protein